jgi:cyclohexanone monooxygenase
MEAEGYDLFEPSQQAEDEWTEHTAEIHSQTLMAQGD